MRLSTIIIGGAIGYVAYKIFWAKSTHGSVPETTAQIVDFSDKIRQRLQTTLGVSDPMNQIFVFTQPKTTAERWYVTDSRSGNIIIGGSSLAKIYAYLTSNKLPAGNYTATPWAMPAHNAG